MLHLEHPSAMATESPSALGAGTERSLSGEGRLVSVNTHRTPLPGAGAGEQQEDEIFLALGHHRQHRQCRTMAMLHLESPVSAAARLELGLFSDRPELEVSCSPQAEKHNCFQQVLKGAVCGCARL